jgi:hypothetical protein
MELTKTSWCTPMETKGDAGAGTVPDATSSKVTNLYVDY